MDAILPAAGRATRMRGIPKFLLPCDIDYKTLIEVHIENLLEICDEIWVPTRPEQVLLIESLGIESDRVIILPMQTQTMTETVLRCSRVSRASNFILAMPDTYFFGQLPYRLLSTETNLVDLACWKIRQSQKGKLGQVKTVGNQVVEIVDKDPNCEFDLAWGALTFNVNLLSYADMSDPHIGYAVKKALADTQLIDAKVIDGSYYDCGTPTEYLELLRRVIV